VIQLDGIRKSFGELEVLSGFSLEVGAGETVVVIGRSGSGKSVLLKHVAGLLRPDAGSVRVGSDEISTATPKQVKRIRLEMGYVFQGAALFDSMTVRENILLALRRHGVAAEERADRVEHSLEVVGLTGWADAHPAELSGGMKKRAGVARAVAPRPDYLLYDEPTSGLDPVTTAMIDELILELKRELEATSLVVTHNMVSAYRVADRIALLLDGRVRWTGTPQEMREEADPAVRAFAEGRRELWPEDSR
jgi:phospholipid/cholesterol/gamma-HCH transport system ATP-binding protein